MSDKFLTNHSVARISWALGYQHSDMLNPENAPDPVNPWLFFESSMLETSGNADDDYRMMNSPQDNSASDDIAQKVRMQLQTLSKAIGIAFETVMSVVGTLANALPHPDFLRFPLVPFLYEKLDGNDVDEMVKLVAVEWTKVCGMKAHSLHITDFHKKQENVERAATAVGLQAPEPTFDLVETLCAFRFKPRKPGWRPATEGLATTLKRKLRPGYSVIVVIALEELSPENGCCLSLKQGEDVCLDGNAPDLLFPSTGGGLGILLDLNI